MSVPTTGAVAGSPRADGTGTATPGIRVWTVATAPAAAAAPYEEAYAVLDEAERSRLAGLRRPGDRMRYLAVHHAFRSVLGRALDIAPAAVRFRRYCAGCGQEGHGKPVPSAPDGRTLAASLSHSGAYALIAVGDGPHPPVGVDIERIRPHMDWSGIPCVSGGGTTHGFEQWTRAEALVKAAGTGLTRTPPHYTGRVFGTWREARVPGSDPRWYVRSVRSPDGYAASVACGSADARVTTVRWVP
ncbi:4'-phosphopantetheinyl transferase [Streptomyces griseochromogenes]|uniref:4'-phosphopantetheinyl transferase n=1 Tax=Streptomyces griseochromogenes TaxID=68214 RepID=A0A1B1ANX6_9ACTN|nr:hypothetical protein [Streptomyces griseochromogenes]ANP48277.1 hypothetical protein AVL59_00660 [Streptomyces griseochromogenes]MBP2050789.1 4'-phosphopantetheinyl transferase [Streptomyces griseochromogenes]